jgi:hypothetical protein
MMVFNMSTSYFHKISFHYFENYLMTKLTLRYGNQNFKIWKSYQFMYHLLATITHYFVFNDPHMLYIHVGFEIIISNLIDIMSR